MTVLDLNAKICMTHLLLKPTFHRFHLIEGEVITSNRFRIDGHIYKDFFDEAPTADYSCWEDLQQYFFSIIRGKRTPLSFKIILSLNPDDFPSFLNSRGLSLRYDEIQGLYLNFRYDGKNLQCVTGISMKTFTMDKTLEKEWDTYVKEFFAKNVEQP